ncbi:hypothetical protein FIBSPDRAFT_876010, partial [Athelia psychrophila]
MNEAMCGGTHPSRAAEAQEPAHVPRGGEANEFGEINAESTTGRGERTRAGMGAGAGVAGGTQTPLPPPPGSAARSGSGRIKEGIVSVQRTNLPPVLHRCFV